MFPAPTNQFTKVIGKTSENVSETVNMVFVRIARAGTEASHNMEKLNVNMVKECLPITKYINIHVHQKENLRLLITWRS